MESSRVVVDTNIFIDYLRYKELTSNSKAKQSDVNELTKEVNKTIWTKVKKQRGL